MACFLAPTAAAVITTVVRKKIAPKYHLGWLITMLWGGVIMLVVDHIFTGEVVFYSPFLTAMKNPADVPVMLQELAMVGGAMTITVIAVWAVMVVIANKVIVVTKRRDVVSN